MDKGVRFDRLDYARSLLFSAAFLKTPTLARGLGLPVRLAANEC